MLVVGLIERCGQTLYDSAVVLKSGELIAGYRKRHIHEAAFARGQERPIFERGANLGDRTSADGQPTGVVLCAGQ